MKKTHKTLVFNELYNWLIINELCFRVKNEVFWVFLTFFVLFGNYILILNI